MNKEGQFFLIAALVIIATLLGLAVVYNSVNSPKEDTQIQGLSQEINYESSQVIQQGLYNNLEDNQINSNIQGLSQLYSQSNPESDILIIYSTSNKITLITYNSTSLGSIGIGDSQQQNKVPIKTIKEIDRNSGEEEYSINVKGTEYDFDLTEGQNFFLIIRKDKNDERIVTA